MPLARVGDEGLGGRSSRIGGCWEGSACEREFFPFIVLFPSPSPSNLRAQVTSPRKLAQMKRVHVYIQHCDVNAFAQVSRLAEQNAGLSSQVASLAASRAPLEEEVATLHAVKARLAEEARLLIWLPPCFGCWSLALHAVEGLRGL